MKSALNKPFWKILTILLILFTIVGGFLFDVPQLAILEESIRNLYFHVPMWFGMLILFLVSVVYSFRYLSTNNLADDVVSVELVNVGLLFGFLGLFTGMVWAEFTWGSWWSNDPKQVNSAIALLIYLAYTVLRSSIVEPRLKAKVAAVFNVFAFASLIPLLFILPRMTDSLHPGSGGNPGFNAYDLDSRMRIIFYPAIIGWTLLGLWLATLKIRLRNIENVIIENE
jgi:heme exporter protein C